MQMKDMKKGMCLLLLCCVLSACQEKTEKPRSLTYGAKKVEYFTFGTYYGFCGGEQCIEIFQLTSDALLEDKKDQYPTNIYTGDFSTDRSDKIDVARELLVNLPLKLFDQPNGFIGCPDCSDGGGVYIELKIDGEIRFWHIDIQRAPDYLTAFVAKTKDIVKSLQ